MSRRGRASPSVADLARLIVVCDADETQALAGRMARDQALRDTLADDLGRWPRLRAWLEHVDSDGRVGQQVDDCLRTTGTLIVAFGALTGWLSTLGAFYYDGGARVNVPAVLGVLVGLPLVLLAASWFGLLAGSGASNWPALRALGAALRRLSAGRLAEPLSRLFRGDGRRGLEVLLGRSTHGDLGIGAVRRWLLARWSHACACAFFTAALATAFALVVFTDLAFGWSTTLDVDAPSAHRVTQAIAWPWSWALPQAAPTLELVELSRYFRIQGETAPAAGAAALGRWWAFLLAALLAYGLLPRVVSLACATWVLQRAVERALLAHPGPRTLLERLDRAEVETANPLAVTDAVTDTAPAARGAPAWPPAAATAAVVNWSGVGVADTVLCATVGAAQAHHAGAGADLTVEAALARSLAAHRLVTVICKAWEPPMLDLHDFLDELAAAGVDVQVLPVRVAGAGLVAPAARDREVWARAFAASGARLVALREGDA